MDTSLAAYEELVATGADVNVRERIYNHLLKHGPKTGATIQMELVGLCPDLGKTTVRRRLNELQDEGRVIQVGVALCPVSKRNQKLWAAVPADRVVIPVIDYCNECGQRISRNRKRK